MLDCVLQRRLEATRGAPADDGRRGSGVRVPAILDFLVPGGDVYGMQRDAVETMDMMSTSISYWSSDKAWPERVGRWRDPVKHERDDLLREKFKGCVIRMHKGEGSR